MNPRVTVMFAGIGGQGVLAAARVLGEAGHRQGLVVTVSQLHDLAQRGGAVQSSVTFATDGVFAPEPGKVDVLIGLEPIEALRASPSLSPQATILCDTRIRPPPPSATGGIPVPALETIAAELRRHAALVHLIDASGLAERAGSAAAVNAVLLGAFSRLPSCPVRSDLLLASLDASLAANRTAFELGRKELGPQDGA